MNGSFLPLPADGIVLQPRPSASGRLLAQESGARFRLRNATETDVPRMVQVINDAYEVERFFKNDDRATVEDIHRLVACGPGGFWVAVDGADRVVATVYINVEICFLDPQTAALYFGFLAVDAALQRAGVGRGIIQQVFRAAKEANIAVVKLSVVDVRPELLRTYERMGFRQQGTRPLEHPKLLMPVQLITCECPSTAMDDGVVVRTSS